MPNPKPTPESSTPSPLYSSTGVTTNVRTVMVDGKLVPMPDKDQTPVPPAPQPAAPQP